MGHPTFQLDRMKTGDSATDATTTLELLSDNWRMYDLVAYTDGSAVEGIRDGGQGVVITSGHPKRPAIIKTIALPAGRCCLSLIHI